MDFVYELPNNLSDEKCEEMIKRFEADDRKKRGVTLAEDDNEHKKSMDLHLSGLDEWKDMDEYLNQQLKIGLKEYMSYIIESGYGNLKGFYFQFRDPTSISFSLSRRLTYLITPLWRPAIPITSPILVTEVAKE